MRRVYLLAAVVGIVLLLALMSPPSATRAEDEYWTGQYYSNRNLSGTPAATRQDSVITFNWFDGPPVDGLPVDNFSVRWTRRDHFDSGPYMFGVCSDDGARVYVDGVRIINDWVNHEYGNWKVAERQMTAGDHTIVVEYYDATGSARIQAGYEPKRTPTPKGPTATITKTPTKGPSPTPTKTFTPRPTKTPNIIGTVGAKPTAFRPPPTLVPTAAPGSTQASGATPAPSANVVISEADSKLFIWKGFPGPAVTDGGQGGSHYYMKTRNSKSNFEAMWNFVPAQSGYFDVYVFVPASTRATQTAVYQVYHGGQLSPGVVVDQMAYPDQWVLLGNYYFTGGQVGQYVYLSNQTSDETATRDILVDAVMIIYTP